MLRYASKHPPGQSLSFCSRFNSPFQCQLSSPAQATTGFSHCWETKSRRGQQVGNPHLASVSNCLRSLSDMVGAAATTATTLSLGAISLPYEWATTGRDLLKHGPRATPYTPEETEALEMVCIAQYSPCDEYVCVTTTNKATTQVMEALSSLWQAC
jgi:hypothetical protein